MQKPKIMRLLIVYLSTLEGLKMEYVTSELRIPNLHWLVQRQTRDESPARVEKLFPLLCYLSSSQRVGFL